MAQKMTLTAYLAQRGKKAKALTKGEAAILGIPFPLQAGWPRRYGAIEIDDGMLERLTACIEAARQALREGARCNKIAEGREPAAEGRLRHSAKASGRRVICGFVLRQARRYQSRHFAPWV